MAHAVSPSRRLLGPGLLVTLLWGCGAAPGADLDVDGAASAAAALQAATPFATCEQQTYSGAAATGFHAWRNAVLSGGAPHHSAQDVIGNPGAMLQALAWFSYGATHGPLGGENVRLALDTCAAWQRLGEVETQRDGTASLLFAAPPVGRYELVQEVAGDLTGVAARVHVVPPGTHVVVFDIDGTLTVDNNEFVRQVVHPSYVPRAFDDAATATRAWAARGYVVVYMTGRPVGTSQVTRQWLDALGFAPGHLHLAKYSSDLWPNNDGVGAYKRDYLRLLQGLGMQVDYAYGNEPTDVFAYRAAGLAADRIYTVGPKAGIDGSVALPRGYGDHLDFIAAQPQAEQPFAASL